MIQISNLAQFKKALYVGLLLNCIQYKFTGKDPNGKLNFEKTVKPTRAVSIVQSNSFALKTTKTDGTVTDSWLAYPKATDCEIKDNKINCFTTHPIAGQYISLVYSFAENDQAASAGTFTDDEELQAILSMPVLINGNVCYGQF